LATLSDKQCQFAGMVGRLLVYAASLAIRAKVTTWFRSLAEQQALLARKATRTLLSKHRDGLAVDLAIIDRDGKYLTDSPLYQQLGEYWESIGGTWGGRWKTLHDRDHFEFKEAA
jgi:D-alanyl-D-alanine dipeptidase